MKKILITVFLVSAFLSKSFAAAQLVITTKLDNDNMPVDNLTEIPFVMDRQYLMFVYQDDNTAFGVEKIYFEVNIYNEAGGKYEYSDLYTVDTQKEWGYCYEGIFFNKPMKLKLKVFTDNRELVTKYIEVVK